jgi:hypothetical protein
VGVVKLCSTAFTFVAKKCAASTACELMDVGGDRLQPDVMVRSSTGLS